MRQLPPFSAANAAPSKRASAVPCRIYARLFINLRATRCGRKAKRQLQGTFLLEEVVMKCEHIAELLPDYLQGSLSPEQHHNAEAHLEQCADWSEEVVSCGKPVRLPVDQPGPAS